MKEYLIVDAYNIINAWEDLKEESTHSLESARSKLLDIMADYQAYKGITVIVVFDAHYVKNSAEKHEIINKVEVVYTKEFESADNYIERLINTIAKDNHVTVATSDWTEQLVVLGLGAVRVSARELKFEVNDMKKNIQNDYLNKPLSKQNTLEHHLDPEVLQILEKWRREDNKA